tara:strand:- start:28 stop:1005 length:978 start_codon:yes stop_codon:yes gene_type:complete
MEGRASRSEFWLFQLHLPILLLVVIFFIDINGPEVLVIFLAIIFWLLVFASLPAQFCLIIRRWHDLGYSRWHFLILLIPFLGAFVTLIFFCFPSSEKGNKYDLVEPSFRRIEESETSSKSQALTTEQIIALKEAKELLDKNVITRSEFDEIKNRRTDGSIVERLKGIADLRNSEVLTEREFQEQKLNILNEMILSNTKSRWNNLFGNDIESLEDMDAGTTTKSVIIGSIIGIVVIFLIFVVLSSNTNSPSYARVEYSMGCWSGAFHNGGSIITISGCGDETFNCMDNGDFCTINAQKQEDNAYELCVSVGSKKACTTAAYGVAQV